VLLRTLNPFDAFITVVYLTLDVVRYLPIFSSIYYLLRIHFLLLDGLSCSNLFSLSHSLTLLPEYGENVFLSYEVPSIAFVCFHYS
jgi:hypothetical protein